MARTYTHLSLNDEVCSISGHYCPRQEVRAMVNGREILYVVGQATVDGSCCANGDWDYALVPGFILNWQNSKNESGQPTSEIEPITDFDTRTAISQLIKSSSTVTQVNFW